MEICIIIFLAFVFGICLYVLGLFFRLKNKNNSANNDLSEYKKQKIQLQNTNFSNFMSVISFIVGTLLETSGIILTIYSIIITNGKSKISTDNIITTSYNEYTYETPTESPTKADSQDTTTEQSIVKTTDIEEQSAIETTVSTYENYGNNIITDDCTLLGTFSSSNTEICYTLHSTYSNVYGFTFYTDNVNLSYTVVITDEKGNEQYSYNIYSDGISESPEFSKNTTYYITLKADEGYPNFKISINYPKSDKFN